MSYSASDAEKIEQGVQRGAVVVKLDRQFEIQFGVGMGDAGGAVNLSDDPPEYPAMQVVSTHPNVRYPVMRDPPLKDQTVLAEPPRYRRQKTMTHDTHVGSFYNMVTCCHDCYRVYLHKDRQRMMSKTRPPVSSKIWREETKNLVDPRMDSSRRGLSLGKDGGLKLSAAPSNLTRAQIRTAGRIVKESETSLMRQLRDADVDEVARKFTMTLIDPSTGRRTQGLGGKLSPPEIQAGSRKHQIAIQ